MSILSINFWVIVFISVIIYWISPSKYRWIILLLANIIFIWFANQTSKRAICLMLGMIAIAYASAVYFDKSSNATKRKIVVIAAVAVEAGLLIRIKENSFFLYWFHVDLTKIPPINLVGKHSIMSTIQ